MIRLKAFDLSVSGVVWRFYLMMAFAVVFGALNQWILAAILAFTTAISFIVGVSVHITEPEKVAVHGSGTKLHPMEKEERKPKAA